MQEVVLYGVCEAYKESANCVRPNQLALLHICAFESDEACLLQRMEAQYAMQRQVRYDLPLLALCVCADRRFALAQVDMIPLMMDRYKPTGWLYVAECPSCE